ncbi:MAG: FtsX-like permease family protein [Alphaproteobacteria bacterium]|nr:FtsX-like permease family protein [Alphaproteobacteria bacterium]
MTFPIQWLKLVRDFEAMAGRLALVVFAMVFGLICTIAITLAYSTLTRDMADAYVSTTPASGILDIGSVDDALLARIKAMDGVAQAEALSIIRTRSRKPDGSFGRGLLFLSAQPLAQQIGTLKVEQTGTAPFPSVMVERRALAVAETQIGGTVTLDLLGIGFTELNISGTVFDPALAPAEQEQAVYAYMDSATWEALGGGPLEMVEIRVSGDASDQTHVNATLTRVANTLRSEGVNVHLVQIPNAEMHPHQSQMTTILTLFLAFGVVAFLLSAFLVSVTIDGLMVQQMQQIAVMKTVGGRADQIRAIYLVGVAFLGAVALLIATPLGQIGGAALAEAVAYLLNFDLTNTTPSPSLWMLWLVTGISVPILFALRPLARATQMPVTAALSDQGIEAPRKMPKFLARFTGGGVGRLALAGVSRNRMRSLLIVALLAAAGTITLSARNIAMSYLASVKIAAQERRHDLDIRLSFELSKAEAMTLLAGLSAQPLDFAYAQEIAPARKDGLAIVRTYPDGGHGSMTLLALEDTASISHFELLAGDMSGGFSGGVVVNQSAFSLLGAPQIGGMLNISLDGTVISVPLIGVVRQYLSPASVYISQGDLAKQTGMSGINTLRLIATDISDLTAVIDLRAQALGSGVASAMSENLMAKAVSGHVNILIVMLSALGAMIAAVGFAGLAAAQSISVIERRREFGVLRAIGTNNKQVLIMLLIEGMIFWSLALGVAFCLSLPFSVLFNNLIGDMTFGMPLPFVIDWRTFGFWAVISLCGSLIASLPPGIAATRSSVATSLNQL